MLLFMGIMPQSISFLLHTMHVNAVKKGKTSKFKNGEYWDGIRRQDRDDLVNVVQWMMATYFELTLLVGGNFLHTSPILSPPTYSLT